MTALNQGRPSDLPAPKPTLLCRGCDLAFCDDHKYLLDQIATHGSHHVIDPSSPVGCSVCVGVVNLDMFQPA